MLKRQLVLVAVDHATDLKRAIAVARGIAKARGAPRSFDVATTTEGTCEALGCEAGRSAAWSDEHGADEVSSSGRAAARSVERLAA